MGEKACLGTRAEQVDFEPVHRLDPGDQIVGEHLDGRHRAGLEKRLEDHEGLCGIVRVVAGLEVAGDDVVLGAVEERVDVPGSGRGPSAGPQFARHAEGVAGTMPARAPAILFSIVMSCAFESGGGPSRTRATDRRIFGAEL